MWAKMPSLNVKCLRRIRRELPSGTLAENAVLHKPTAFFTPAGYGTEVLKGKKFANLMAKCTSWNSPTDFAIVKAWKGDEAGNLI
jgi:3-oxoacid CoA-transferase subunit A